MKTVLLFFLLIAPLAAQVPFPSPPHTLFGIIKTSSGTPLNNPELEIVFLADGVEVASSPVVLNPARTENYRVHISTVTGEPDTRTYSFRLREEPETTVIIFTPVPAGLTRLNLTLNGSDTDGDGLPDDWENTYGGNLDPQDDPDHDGLTNLQEFVIGTIPTDFHSQINFKLLSETEIAFDVVAGRIYEIQGGFGVWEILKTVSATSSKRVTFTVPDRQFYRVGVR